MKEFFKKLGKKLKKFFSWVLFFLIMLIWAVYDFFYNSKAHWKIFKIQFPQFIRYGAILLGLFLIFRKKGVIRKNKTGGAANGENGSGDETGAANGGATAENADQTAAKKTADGTGGNDESQEKNDENRQ